MTTLTADQALLETAEALSHTHFEASRFWTGHSGEVTTGAQLAHYLDTVNEILDSNGWVRVYADSTVDLPGDTSSMSLTDMVRKLYYAIREQLAPSDKRLTFFGALLRACDGGAGDADTRYIAERVLDVIVRARTGSTQAMHGAWVEKLGRTADEVRGLLASASEFARLYGPTA